MKKLRSHPMRITALALAAMITLAGWVGSPASERETSVGKRETTTNTRRSTPTESLNTAESALRWRDLCLLTPDEVSAYVQPPVESGWADMWQKAVSVHEGSVGPGSIGCTYKGDTGMSVIKIIAIPLELDDDSTYERRCAEVSAREPYRSQPDGEAICDPEVCNGMIISNDRAISFLFPGQTYSVRIFMLTVSLGENLTDPLIDISRAVTERWEFR